MPAPTQPRHRIATQKPCHRPTHPNGSSPHGSSPGGIRRDTAALLPLWPHELEDGSLAGRQKRIAVLQRALRAERQRGIAGNWTYDLGRHWALLHWYRTETAELDELTRPVPVPL